MCDICVINSVKSRMLSRREIFRGSAAIGAAAGLAGVAASTPARAMSHGSIVDMTHSFSEDFPTWDGASGLSREQVFNFAEHGFNLYNLTANEHAGTHIDAPLHFSENGDSVDEIPVGNLICSLCVIDIAERADGNPDTMVTPDDLNTWISNNGDIPNGACVAMHSGWADKVGSDAFRNADAEGVQHYPGFHVEATQMLLEQTSAVSIAVDTLSLDHGASADFATHYAWLPANRYGIECLAGLDQMPASGATLIVGAPKVAGSTGGQARIFAMA